MDTQDIRPLSRKEFIDLCARLFLSDNNDPTPPIEVLEAMIEDSERFVAYIEGFPEAMDYFRAFLEQCDFRLLEKHLLGYT